ncbi:MAG TPA: hypothetical protein DC063_13585 [Arenimonas sp.]|nr:MAG: hypothetical protein A2X76_07900 [Xanthomonadales bacterium GWF1_69_6]HBD21002.1 hypothetical protein [Arenimonas sp.]
MQRTYPLLLAAILASAAPVAGAAGPGGDGSADTVRECWPELAGAPKAKPGGAVGRMLRLEAGKSPIARFATGESLVVVVVLPALKKPYALEFQVTPDLNLGRPGEVLLPSVVLVDAEFCAVSSHPELEFKPHYNFFTTERTTRAQVPVSDPVVRHALVYSDPARVGQSVDFELNGFDMGALRRSEQGWTMARINR